MLTSIGHSETGIRLNVRRELRRIRTNPLDSFLRKAFPKSDFGDARSRYEEAFQLYAAAMERAFEQVSTAVRFRKGAYYVLKYGGAYGPGQRALARKRQRLSRFLELDIITCFVQTRILLDRTIALSRCFLNGPELPSFTSFSDHKKFFAKGSAIPGHEAYAEYFREQTAWFDVPIKFPRDKLFVHQGPRHWKFFTIGWGHEDDLVWNVLIPAGEAHEEHSHLRHRDRLVRLNVLRLSYDIENYLTWFGVYGSAALRKER